ncbi:hypothetical protein O3M35_009204 [Rhynocoris fuscipes]|uniref:Uncharacterized protein n=1 Tax=Rhynocoris fuscipes TaxID=488301 RepID=A0AAW1D223_9HEMI
MTHILVHVITILAIYKFTLKQCLLYYHFISYQFWIVNCACPLDHVNTHKFCLSLLPPSLGPQFPTKER